MEIYGKRLIATLITTHFVFTVAVTSSIIIIITAHAFLPNFPYFKVRCDEQVSYQYLAVLREQCQGAFLCLIEMDRMSHQLAAKVAAQEEAGTHAFATYVAIEDCQALLNTEIHNIIVSMHFPADDHALVYWPDEDSVSVIPLSSIASPPAVVGEGCQVRIGRKTFKAVTMKIGMRALLLLLLVLLL